LQAGGMPPALLARSNCSLPIARHDCASYPEQSCYI
jgi:hypothetical protein